MTEANWLPGDDRIEFDLAGPAPVDHPARLAAARSSRPRRQRHDRRLQRSPAAASTRRPFGSNAVPGIELRGNGDAAREVVFRITSPGNTIRGLLLSNVYRGIVLDGADAHDNRIVGNWIGFTRTGTSPSSARRLRRRSSTSAPTTTSSARRTSPTATSSATCAHAVDELRPRHGRQRHPEQRLLHAPSGSRPRDLRARRSTTTSAPRATSSAASARTSATSSAPRTTRASSSPTAGIPRRPGQTTRCSGRSTTTG